MQAVEVQARERALRYLDFLEAYHLQRFPPVHDIGVYQDERITEDSLEGAAGVRFSPAAEAWLTADLLDPPPTPIVPKELRDWLSEPVAPASPPEARHPDPVLRALIALLESPPTGDPADLDTLDVDALESYGVAGVEPGTALAVGWGAQAELDRVASALAQWSTERWQPWSEEWTAVDKGRTFYKKLFDLRTRLEREREQYELVWGFGRTRWQTTADGASVRVDHPMIAVSVEMDIDRDAGTLRVSQAGPAAVEFAWTAGLPLSDRQGYADQRASAEQIELDVWGPGRSDSIRSLLRSVDQDGRLLQHGEQHSFEPSAVADPDGWVLFVRKRRPDFAGFLEAQRKLYNDGAQVSDPFAALVIDEPSVLDRPTEDDDAGDGDRSDGRRISGDQERDLLPLPANEEQLQIVSLARSRAGVTAQGPPGTGKSHTIANLISHYVAHGRRVLVTAEKEQALEVLMDKVPEEIRALCVPVLGSDAAGRDRLQRTVSEISAAAQRRPDVQTIARLERELDELDAKYSVTTNLLRTKREAETRPAPHRPGTTPSEEWTPSGAASWVKEHAHDLEGIPDQLDRLGDPPFGTAELLDLQALSRSIDAADAAAALRVLPSPADLPAGGRLTTLRAEAAQIRLSLSEVEDLVRSWDLIDRCGSDHLAQLASELDDLNDWHTKAAGTWVASVLADAKDQALAAGWHDFCAAAAHERDGVLAVNRTLAAHSVSIRVPGGNPVPDREFWNALNEGRLRFASGKSVGPFQRSAKRALGACTTDGHSPSTAEEIDLVMADIHRRDLRQRLTNRWANVAARIGAPALDGERPVEDLIGERIKAVGAALQWSFLTWPKLAERITGAGINAPAEPDAEGLSALARSCRVLRLRSRLLEVEAEFSRLDASLADGQATPDASALWTDLRQALAAGEDSRWDDLRAEAQRLADLRHDAARRKHLHGLLVKAAPQLAAMVAEGKMPIDPQRFEAAWRWRQLDLWLRDFDEGPQPAALQAKLEQLAIDRRRITTDLVAAKAWAALSESIDDRRRTALNRYTTANTRYGKGTGRYAPTWAAEARQAMVEAQDAVPVWIMPLHKALTSFRPAATPPFDVVIVDEASQVGLLETPILALGRRAIVVGDDQQTSPQNVGLEQQRILDLIDDFLGGISDRKTRFNPQNSLYDIARQRFPQIVQLREHFRCLPRIIEFSSVNWYAGTIVPLRDRPPTPGWQPVGTVFVPSGARRHSDDTNHAEALAVVDLIADLAARDDYKDMSFGVVTLQGSGQAPLISGMLLDRFGPRFIEDRKIRVGDPASFQGDERDVIILSTVVAHDPQRRIGTMTDAPAARRINVAASRARNQLWMVHSVGADAFHADDPRRWLLEHCSAEVDEAAAKAAMEKTESGFERDVLSRILAKGYTSVTAQYAVGGYRIDLVVEGPENRLAVECDGDYWHGPDAWDCDRVRQTVLERAGWTFERIRGSSFYRNPDAALQPLWGRLEELGIPTGDWTAASAPRTPAQRSWPDDFPERLVALTATSDGDDAEGGVEPLPAEPASAVAPELSKSIGWASESPGVYRITYPAGSGSPTAREVRDWARGQGHVVGERGRLHPVIIDAWNSTFPQRRYVP